MSFHNRKSFDDDDDDLESLRLAALKSLATKKEAISPVNGGNAIEVLENGPLSRNISAVRPINTLDNANLHVRLDVTEPYVPQRLSNVGHMDWNYNAAYMGNMHSKATIIPTLSPRSLAFVEQNNDILMRRKGEKSTRSPSPYREEFMRWSESPPPLHKRRSPSFRKSHSRSMSRSPVLNKRFSKSPLPVVKSPRRIVKSPVRNTRPFKKRSKSRSGRSRSPVRRGDSPNRLHPERRRSTSLYSSSHQNKFSSRNNNTKQADRLTPPPIRHRRSSRSQTPIHQRNKSLTPPSQSARTIRKRSRSPFQPSHHLRRSRSNSRSPHRKARPRSREHLPGGGGGGGYSKGINNNKHYANKNIEFNRKYLSQNNYSNRNNNNNNNNKYHNNSNKYKYDNRREPPRSPAKYRSKSKSPVAHHHSENGPKPDNKKIISTSSNSNNKIECSSSGSKEIMPQNELEHDKLSSTDDDDQNSTDNDDNNDEDGIDLFASEESESENEGRFKSSSKNTDNKKVATLSYSKLSETAAVCVSELKDMNANSNWNDRDYARRNIGDRDRDRDRKNNRRDRDRDGVSWKSSRRNRTKEDDSDSRSNKKTEKSSSSNSANMNGMKMFRSTFQAVDDSNLNSKKENTSKINEEKSISKSSTEVNSETRNVLHLKRTLIPTKEVDKAAMSTDESTKTHETGVSSESTGGKKPIHLRLGAISNSSSKMESGGGSGSGGNSGSHSHSGKPNTSWKSKKSWRTEKALHYLNPNKSFKTVNHLARI